MTSALIVVKQVGVKCILGMWYHAVMPIVITSMTRKKVITPATLLLRLYRA